jgi:hypothetical protein
MRRNNLVYISKQTFPQIERTPLKKPDSHQSHHKAKQMKFVPSISNTSLFEVFDPQFKFVKEIPASLVRHLPPARLNITRLVFCRNYVPGQLESCNMGDGCKFVHADVDPESLESHPIHVKYSWRHEDVCTYARLPAGEVLRVTAPNNRPPVEEIASERVLVTRGSVRRDESTAPISHCAHYFFNRMCNRGERCNFIHVVHVDPNVVGDFKRAPARCVVSVPRSDRAVPEPHVRRNGLAEHDIPQPAKFSRLIHDAQARLQKTSMQARSQEAEQYPDVAEQLPRLTLLPACSTTPVIVAPAEVPETKQVTAIQQQSAGTYRHNPYSLLNVTVVAV